MEKEWSQRIFIKPKPIKGIMKTLLGEENSRIAEWPASQERESKRHRHRNTHHMLTDNSMNDNETDRKCYKKIIVNDQ